MYIIFWYIIGFCSWGFLCKLLRIRWIPEEANFWGKLIQLLKALQVIFKEFSLGMKNKFQETLISVFEIDLKSCNHHSLEHTYIWSIYLSIEFSVYCFMYFFTVEMTQNNHSFKNDKSWKNNRKIFYFWNFHFWTYIKWYFSCPLLRYFKPEMGLHFSYWDLFILLMNIPSPKLRRFKLEKLKCLLWSVLKSWKQGNYCRLLCFFKKKHFFIVFGVKLTPSNFQSLWKWTSFRNQQVLCIKYIF